jgi:nitrite reductase/ring-hydroxylating ferredoxin subunit
MGGCMKQPCFNFEGEIPKFCADHKEEGMVNLNERPCEKCSKKPVYNFPDIKKGRFCVEHKEDGMIDVLSQTCEHDGCRTRPSFGYKEGKRRFCVLHKLDDMVNLVSAMCIHEGCVTCASFNFIGEKDVLYCSKHKKEGMILLRGPHCAKSECIIHPVFNLPGSKRGKFCRQHKEPGMVDVEGKRCKTPLCDIHTPKDYCSRCTAYMFPDQPTRFKTREMKLKEYLQTTYPDKDLTHDKRVGVSFIPSGLRCLTSGVTRSL